MNPNKIGNLRCHLGSSFMQAAHAWAMRGRRSRPATTTEAGKSRVRCIRPKLTKLGNLTPSYSETRGDPPKQNGRN